MELKKLLVAGVLLMIILGTPIVIAGASEYIHSRVVFTVAETLTFTITTPETGDPNNYSDPAVPGNTTNDIWFNSTSADSTHVEPCMLGGSDCQDHSGGTPILRFRNVGTVSFNISMRLNTTLDATLDLEGNVSNYSSMALCSGWTLGSNRTGLDDAAQWYFTKAMCPGNYTDVYLWANFSTASGVKYNYLNYTSDNT